MYYYFNSNVPINNVLILIKIIRRRRKKKKRRKHIVQLKNTACVPYYVPILCGIVWDLETDVALSPHIYKWPKVSPVTEC